MDLKVSPPQETPQVAQSSTSLQTSLQRSQPVETPHQGSPQANANPFSREALAAKRASVFNQTREERNVSQPPKKDTQAEKPAETVTSAAAPAKTDTPSASSSPANDVAAEWVKRERAVTEAEARLKNAHSDAEKRSAKAEADEAKAAKALADLEAAKHEPMEFLAKVGMNKEEWEEFVAGGGKQSAQAKKLRAIETRFTEMEDRYKALAAKAEESERKRVLDAENAAFTDKLGSYTFISKIGGLAAVRNKQSAIRQQEGRDISLAQAADLVEGEIEGSLGPLLKFDDVRRKLNLDARDQPAAAEKPQTKTLNGAEGGKNQTKAVEDEDPKPWDFAAKKRKAFKLIEAAQKRAQRA